MPRGGRRRTTWTKTTRPKSKGRPKGSKDSVSRSFKGSIKQIFEDIATEDPELIYDAIVKGLKAPAPRSFSYLQLMTVYIDGRPREAVPIEQVRALVDGWRLLVQRLIIDEAMRREFAIGMRRLVTTGE